MALRPLRLRPGCAITGHPPTAWRTGEFDPKHAFKMSSMNGREARESGLWWPAVPRHRDHGAGVQVLGLRTASTTSRIAAMTSSGWSWWMLCPLFVAMA